MLRRCEPGSGWLATAALGAGLVSVAVKLASFPLGTVAFYDALDPALIHANDISFVTTWGIDGAFLAATAAVVLRTGGVPRWVGWTAAAIAPLLLCSVAMARSESAQLPTALFLLWIVGVSVHLLRSDAWPRPASSPARPAARPGRSRP